jgi:uncharacterized membrane protein YvbJ
MQCPYCAKTIPNDSTFCSECGVRIESVTEESPIIFDHAASTISNKKTGYFHLLKSKKVIIPIIACIALFLCLATLNEYGKANLKKELLRDWLNIITEDNGTIYKLVLEFSEDKFDYNFESAISWLDTTIATYDYKVVSPDKIVIAESGYEREITIKFNDEKSIMTVTPAITSTESSEDWYNLD